MRRGRRFNLTEPLTELIGRDAALDLLETHFERDGRRWVTIRGVPGVGKTRLALHYAGTQPLSRFPGGIWVCDLQRARDAREVRRAIAKVLALPLSSSRAAIEAALTKRSRTLLVLDGAERVAHRLGPTIEKWLMSVPALRVLVTSESRIGVCGETSLVLGPLEEQDAIALFRARSLDVRGSELPPQSEDAITAIVRALDALPLAIELAAGACSAHLPEELVPRVGGIVDALTRRTSRSRIASMGLLSPSARRVLRVCALFAGDFSPEIVSAIHAAPPEDSALALSELCDRSLLVTRETTRGTLMRLPITIRGPVRRALERTSGADGLRARFERIVLERAEHAARGLDSGDGIHALSSLRCDVEIIVSRALARDELRTAARGVLVLAPLAVLQGPTEGTWSLLEEILSRDRALDTETQARLRYARARLSRHLGRPAVALDELRMAREIAEPLGQTDLVARIVTEQAHLFRHLGRRDEARGLYHRALTIHEIRGDIGGQGRTLAALAAMAHEEDKLGRARELFARAIGLLERARNRLELATTRQNLGLVELEAGELDLAESTFLRALAGHRALGHRRFEAICELDLACLELSRGRALEALHRLENAQEHVRASGDRRELGWAFALAYACHAMLGELEEADDSFARALSEIRALEQPGLTEALDVLGGLRDLASALHARFDGDSAIAKRWLRSVDARIARATSMRDAGDELRFGLRLVQKEHARFAARARSALVASDGAWFSISDQARVNLTSKPLLRVLLSALLEQHLRRGDAPASSESLIRRCWPNERFMASVHKNRLHVAIATLRELGLRAHLVGDRRGYRLELIEVIETSQPNKKRVGQGMKKAPTKA